MDGALFYFGDAALCAYGQRERPADYGADQLMKQLSLPYHIVEPPKAVRKARLDNIALVLASLLPRKGKYQTIANNLPRGGGIDLSDSQETADQSYSGTGCEVVAGKRPFCENPPLLVDIDTEKIRYRYLQITGISRATFYRSVKTGA